MQHALESLFRIRALQLAGSSRRLAVQDFCGYQQRRGDICSQRLLLERVLLRSNRIEKGRYLFEDALLDTGRLHGKQKCKDANGGIDYLRAYRLWLLGSVLLCSCVREYRVVLPSAADWRKQLATVSKAVECILGRSLFCQLLPLDCVA